MQARFQRAGSCLTLPTFGGPSIPTDSDRSTNDGTVLCHRRRSQLAAVKLQRSLPGVCMAGARVLIRLSSPAARGSLLLARVILSFQSGHAGFLSAPVAPTAISRFTLEKSSS